LPVVGDSSRLLGRRLAAGSVVARWGEPSASGIQPILGKRRPSDTPPKGAAPRALHYTFFVEGGGISLAETLLRPE